MIQRNEKHDGKRRKKEKRKKKIAESKSIHPKRMM